MIKNVIFRNRKKNIIFDRVWKLRFLHSPGNSKFSGNRCYRWGPSVRDFYFFNFWLLEIVIKIKSKNIQLSIFLSFFELDLFSRNWPSSWSRDLNQSRDAVLESPAEIILVRVTRDQKRKYQIFDLTLIVIVAKGTNPKSKCSTITVTSSCLIFWAYNEQQMTQLVP